MIADKFQQLWSDALSGDVASVLALVCFMGMYLCVTVALEVHLWKRCDPAAKKFLWALVIPIPVLGWLFYLAFYKVPPSQHFR